MFVCVCVCVCGVCVSECVCTFQASPVSFSVQPVPDSLQQQGSFKIFHDRGTLKNLINVEPADPIEITGQGLELQFPVPDGMPIL